MKKKDMFIMLLLLCKMVVELLLNRFRNQGKVFHFLCSCQLLCHFEKTSRSLGSGESVQKGVEVGVGGGGRYASWTSLSKREWRASDVTTPYLRVHLPSLARGEEVNHSHSSSTGLSC